MGYSTLEESLIDLENKGQLIRIKELVDPYLEMSAIHLRVYAAGGPALLFENVKGSKFRVASNIFGTLERSKFIFRDTLSLVQQLIELKNDPVKALKNPIKNFTAGLAALKSLPLKNPLQKPALFQEIKIEDIPLIHHWPMDGGAFVTLPQVYTEDIDQPGIMKSNLGMYRIQLTGNEYVLNEEIGLLYLDSLDYEENLQKESQEHQLNEIEAAYPKLTQNSIILLDDNDFPNGGKTKLTKEYLLKNNWQCVLDHQQSLWIKKL